MLSPLFRPSEVVKKLERLCIRKWDRLVTASQVASIEVTLVWTWCSSTTATGAAVAWWRTGHGVAVSGVTWFQSLSQTYSSQGVPNSHGIPILFWGCSLAFKIKWFLTCTPSRDFQLFSELQWSRIIGSEICTFWHLTYATEAANRTYFYIHQQSLLICAIRRMDMLDIHIKCLNVQSCSK